MDDVVTAYVADSAASAPPPRGLPLSLQAPSRQSSVVVEPRSGRAESTTSTDDWDDAAAPTLTATTGGDDDGPPLDELDAHMQGDVAAQTAPEAPRAARRGAAIRSDNDDEEVRGSTTPLPELDELVSRLPAAVQETLDEFFRVRFVSVKKISRRVLAPAAQGK